MALQKFQGLSALHYAEGSEVRVCSPGAVQCSQIGQNTYMSTIAQVYVP
jgi:hypothetical protein